MACDGVWEPLFRFPAGEVERQTSVRDCFYGEKVVQTFLLAYLSATDYYVARSEEEFGKGFADPYLEPFRTKCADLNYGYLIEIKYAGRSVFTEEKKKKLLDEAKEQLKRYLRTIPSPHLHISPPHHPGPSNHPGLAKAIFSCP